MEVVFRFAKRVIESLLATQNSQCRNEVMYRIAKNLQNIPLSKYTVNIFRSILGNNFVTLYPYVYRTNQGNFLVRLLENSL